MWLLVVHVSLTSRKRGRFTVVISGECADSGKPGEAAHQAGLGPPAAKSEGVARTDKSESDEDERIDDVIVHEYVVLGRKRRAPHQDEQDRTGDGGDAHPDAEQTDHKQPVHQACARDGLVKAREGADGTAEEAKGGGSSVNPPVGGGGLVTKPEGLVQEWPQEGPAQAQPGECPHVSVALLVVDSAVMSPVIILRSSNVHNRHLSGCD